MNAHLDVPATESRWPGAEACLVKSVDTRGFRAAVRRFHGSRAFPASDGDSSPGTLHLAPEADSAMGLTDFHPGGPLSRVKILFNICCYPG
jgi:hypothetical protein